MSHSKTLTPLTDAKLKAAFGAMAHPRDFRPFVPAEKAPAALNSTRKDRTAEVMATDLIRSTHDLWGAMMAEPFKGITTDGTLRPAPRVPAPNGAPRMEMEAAAQALLDVLRPEIASQILFDTNAPEWRRWHNMPVQWDRDGVGLEEMNAAERAAMHGLIRASLSEAGYAHVVELMEVNRFSGALIGREKYLNEHCYTVGVFGKPGEAVWGWQIYGHHLCLSCRLIGDTYILTPTFLAAEPTVVDEGAMAGINAFVDNEDRALDLIRALSPDLRAKAVTLNSILNADVPEGRRHWADSLHLGGAFQDNRVIPLEGVCAAEFTDGDKTRLMELFETFFLLLPEGPKQARLAEIAAYLDDTWLCWMGGHDDWSPFYFRLHSPVVLAEFDHHQAVFLTNSEPARFHVHTLTRHPEGGDYGMDLLDQI
ncbi:DUF3500 domain-containing protein [Pseudoprimorskyibacter insulae]|uniref:DUF3500 domain-containing protein n=1 Tax=Pseudoprimorskyibacter insulae TaxID=1695997 RepID=A0A2R8AQL0_9RHOB|nr:DUF3500 domain-containing protein [Pseudoprimorskyibacter insulae]SPF78157.1 hypothetical protein PRI8871_00750 [Pseudoprimorskyibacter insulae]